MGLLSLQLCWYFELNRYALNVRACSRVYGNDTTSQATFLIDLMAWERGPQQEVPPHPLLFYPVILVSKWRNMPFAWVKSKRPFTVWSKHKLELFHQKMVINLLSGTFKAMGDGWLFCPKAWMNVQDTPNKRTVKRFTQYLHVSCGGWQFNWFEEIQRLKFIFDFSLKKSILQVNILHFIL